MTQMDDKISSTNNQLYEFGSYRLDVAGRRLYRDNMLVRVTRKVFDLLLILVERCDRLVSREELIGTLWPNTFVEEQNLTTKIYALRKVLGDVEENPRYLETVRGVGYRFIAPVTRVAPVSLESEPDSQSPAAHLTASPNAHAWRKRAAVALVLTGLLVGAGAGHFRQRSRIRLPGSPVLAVLPFENLSPDSGNAYFAAGIQDTILTRLADINHLQVIARTSVESYTSRPENLRQIADELHASLILEGSVQKTGDNALINVRLIDAGTDTQLWAHTYTQTLDNIFNVEGSVAAEVAQALELKLLPPASAKLARPPTTDSQAYLLFLKANYLAYQVIDRRTANHPDTTSEQAISLYRKTLERDPHFALAYARLSLLETFAYWWRVDFAPEHLLEAERTAEQAISLDSSLPLAHMALGYVQYYGHRNYPAALSEFEWVHQAQPGNADAVGAIAFIHRRQGKWRQSLAELQRARALDPRNPHWSDEAGITALALREYPQAEQLFNQTLAIEPENYDVEIRKFRLLLSIGNLDQASQILSHMRRDKDPLGLVSTSHFAVFMFSRKPDQALVALKNAPTWVSDGDSFYRVPKTLLQADAWALKGDRLRAHQLYMDARDKLRTALHAKPDDPLMWGALALAEAGCRDKAAALDAATKATRMLPVSKDAFDGPALLETLAVIYAKSGKSGRAIALLKELLATPAGGQVSVAMLKLNPAWDPIRADPRFQALLTPPQPPSPVPATTL